MRTIHLARRQINVETLILGTGPTSSTVLSALSRGFERPSGVDAGVMRVGLGSFWTGINPMHEMGQSSDILLPATHRPPSKGFLKVGEFLEANRQRDEQSWRELGGGFDIRADILSLRKRGTNHLHATIRTPDGLYDIEAGRVISAQGAGVDALVNLPISPRRSGTKRRDEFTTGVKSLTNEATPLRGGTVMIAGDGPTALWAAWVYMLNGCDVHVMGPPTDKAFSASNPGGRNSEIMRQLENAGRLWKGSFLGVESREIGVANDPGEAGLLVYVDNCERLGAHNAKQRVFPITRFVHAVGSVAPSNLYNFSLDVVSDMSPLEDIGATAAEPNSVALMTREADVVVVGAQGRSMAAIRGYKGFDASGLHIGQPPVGIATNDRNVGGVASYLRALKHGASAKDMDIALLRLVSLDDFNPQRARYAEFVKYLTEQGVDDSGAKEIAEKCEERRSSQGSLNDKEFADVLVETEVKTSE